MTLWLPLQSAITWAAIAAVFAQTTRLPPVVVVLGAAALLVGIITATAAHTRVIGDNLAASSFSTWESRTVEAMVPPTVRQLRDHPGTSVREPGGGGVLVGLVLELIKEGVRPVVAQEWCSDIGPLVDCREPSNPELVIRSTWSDACHELVLSNSLRLCLEQR